MAHREYKREHKRWYNSRFAQTDKRLVFLQGVILFMVVVIVWRLFTLSVLNHSFYNAVAVGQYEIIKDLFPKRGSIYLQNTLLSSETRYEPNNLTAVATNRKYWHVYMVPSEITDPEGTAQKLSELFFSPDKAKKEIVKEKGELPPEQMLVEVSAKQKGYEEKILTRVSKSGDPYEPVASKVSDEMRNQLSALGLTGVDFEPESHRYYPEGNIGSHIVGFVGETDEHKKQGLYGLESYFEEELAGKQGFLHSEKDGGGRLITLSDTDFKPAVDGSNIVLTIDYSLQHSICQKLNEALPGFEADAGSIVVMRPKTGAILAMCGAPDYNPNNFNDVKDIHVYNNPVLFEAYEPGSIFKGITMAAGLDLGKVAADTTYEDKGQIIVGGQPINNFDGRAHGVRSMVDVLRESLNLGTVFVVEQTGKDDFTKYVQDFGFGNLTGIELPSEGAGDISQLDKKGVVYSYTASFGQGITVTPLQMVSAYSAIANGGVLVQPHIVDRIVKSDGTVVETPTREVRQVISDRTATLLSGMLVTAVREGHAKRAQVPGYLIAGKTGTAQVAEKGVYGEQTIHSFVGYGPVENPVFTMLVRIDHPRKGRFAETTAVPLFGELAKFILNYYQVPPSE